MTSGISSCCRAAYLVVVSLLALSGCAESDDNAGSGPDERPPQMVVTEPTVYDTERSFVEAVGTSRALQSVSLRPAVTGEVSEVLFATGDWVERDEVLLRLDDRDERLAVQLAEVELAEAERRVDRFQRSIDSGGVTRSDLDDAKSAVQRAQIALQRAQVDLDYHTIRAPFAGHVGMTNIDPGSWIGPETEITTLDDRSTLLVRFSLPEMLLGKLPAGETVQLSTWGDQFAIAEGTVVDVDSRVDEARRTFQLRAHVPNLNDLLRPGMSFRIRLTLEGNRYPQVPEVSLQWGGEGAFVWIIEDGKTKRLPVNLVQRQDEGVLVEGDLPEGTPVVTEGVHVVREGMRIRVLSLADESSNTASVQGETAP
ncbi:MAG TPA: efflux RND transporter periplasmic adaptor subunit [Cellvibrionaceae bacterium]